MSACEKKRTLALHAEWNYSAPAGRINFFCVMTGGRIVFATTGNQLLFVRRGVMQPSLLLLRRLSSANRLALDQPWEFGRAPPVAKPSSVGNAQKRLNFSTYYRIRARFGRAGESARNDLKWIKMTICRWPRELSMEAQGGILWPVSWPRMFGGRVETAFAQRDVCL